MVMLFQVVLLLMDLLQGVFDAGGGECLKWWCQKGVRDGACGCLSRGC